MKAKYSPNDLCYLCSLPLRNESVNLDHVFQKQFIRRLQPLSRLFDYGGTLPVHKKCNSLFGGGKQRVESICRKALHLLEVMHSDRSLNGVLNGMPIFALPSPELPEFTQADIEYFGFSNASQTPYDELSSGRYFADKRKINPFQKATTIALSTLAKSVAGFLVKRHSFPLGKRWRILALPYYAQNSDFTLHEILGDAKPLEVGVTLWIVPQPKGWFCAYKYERLLIYFYIEPELTNAFHQIRDVLADAECLYFDSTKLIDLVNHDWPILKI